MNTKISKELQSHWNDYLSYDKSRSDVADFYSIDKGAITEKSSIFYKKHQTDIFLLAMAIGVELDSRRSLKTPSNTIRRNVLDEEATWLMCSIVLAQDDVDIDVLANSRKITRICEEYANEGIGTLIQLDKQLDADNTQYERFLNDALDKTIL